MMMTVLKPPGPADSGVRSLLARFPVPLALVDAAGGRFVNARFEALLDPASLDCAPLAEVVAAPDHPWRRLLLAGRDGASFEARVQAQRTPEGVLLVVDETPDHAGSGGPIEEMRARIAELERLSATDRLTGAWNRAHLDRMIETELSRSLRFRQPVSLILLDIDHFKDVNDTHGHAVGDLVLRELVQVMRESVRSADLVFRWGGEEFVVLAASTSYRSAAVLAEKLRSAVARHAFPVIHGLTVSAGVAEHLASESVEAWFLRVDAALYQAKSGGRDRVCVDRRGSSDIWSGGGRSALRLAWLEEYECGEPTIDRQHRELFDLANALIDAVASPDESNAAVREAFALLSTHIERHFRDEEALLAKAGYAHLESHARAHSNLLARALELKKAADEGDAPFGEVIEFLANEMVARHLFTADRDYFPLFAAAGRPH